MTPHDPTSLSLDQQIEAFVQGSAFAVVGASTNRAKYGNKVLRVYQQTGRTAYPINPRAQTIEGVTAYPDLQTLADALSGPVHGISIITPPAITEQVMQQAADLGIQHAWMQPGAESADAIRIGEQAGMNVIAGNACLLVVLGFSEQA